MGRGRRAGPCRDTGWSARAARSWRRHRQGRERNDSPGCEVDPNLTSPRKPCAASNGARDRGRLEAPQLRASDPRCLMIAVFSTRVSVRVSASDPSVAREFTTVLIACPNSTELPEAQPERQRSYTLSRSWVKRTRQNAPTQPKRQKPPGPNAPFRSGISQGKSVVFTSMHSEQECRTLFLKCTDRYRCFDWFCGDVLGQKRNREVVSWYRKRESSSDFN